MEKVRFGVIGTNFITDWMLSAAKQVPGFELAAVCSRSLERAQAYGALHGAAARCFDDAAALAACDGVDAVYIATPNLHHCAAALMMLEAGKHVLVEKPAAVNAAQFAQMRAAAEAKGLVLMEGMRPLYLPAHAVLRRHLAALGPVRRVAFGYSQYSSRYDKFKNGVVENAFRPELANGALMDIGVYPLSLIVALFGAPQWVQAAAVKLENGLDGMGEAILGYPGMLASASYSKITDGFAPNTIQGESASLLFDTLIFQRHITLKTKQGEEDLSPVVEKEDMAYELEAFIRFVHGAPGAVQAVDVTHETLRVMDEIRRQVGMPFPPDLTS